jgi:hypothetical protein
MKGTQKLGSPAARVRRATGPLLLVLVTVLAAPAAAAQPAEIIVLPGSSSAKGIAAGPGATFYAGDFLAGDVFRGDVRRGIAELFIDAPDGRMAVGAGVPGPFRTLALSGPAADISGEFNLNGIQATANGKTLIVAHSANDELYTVDPTSGASAAIAGVSVPNVDGIVLEGSRLWVVQGPSNQVTRIRLSPHLSSGVVEKVITSDLFQFPTTAARFGRRLAVVNAKFDTGIPPTADQYEVVLIHG